MLHKLDRHHCQILPTLTIIDDGDVVTHWKCGDSLEMWWLIGDAVAHCFGCGDSFLEM